jgi:hypothetical protein
MTTLRTISALLALLYAVNAAIMVADPLRWYATTPGLTDTGPFNVHFVTDIGFIYLAAGAGFLAWAVRPALGVGILALAALWPALHAGFHLALMAQHVGHGMGLATELLGVCLPGVVGIAVAWQAAVLARRSV